MKTNQMGSECADIAAPSKKDKWDAVISENL
jgi:hypothetical protein